MPHLLYSVVEWRVVVFIQSQRLGTKRQQGSYSPNVPIERRQVQGRLPLFVRVANWHARYY